MFCHCEWNPLLLASIFPGCLASFQEPRLCLVFDLLHGRLMIVILILRLGGQVIISTTALLVERSECALLVGAQEILTPSVSQQRRILDSRANDVVVHQRILKFGATMAC